MIRLLAPRLKTRVFLVGTGMGNSQKLSRQQEIFADLLFKTGKQSDAYREAYPRSKAWKQAHVHQKACLLAKNVKVMQRLSELEAAKQAKIRG